MHVEATHANGAGDLAVLESLAQVHDWLDNLVQSIVEGVVIFDDAGSVTFLNEKAAELTGGSVAEAVGQQVDLLFPATDEAGSRVALSQFVGGGKYRIQLLKPGKAAERPVRLPGQLARRRLGTGLLSREPLSLLEITVMRLPAPVVYRGSGATSGHPAKAPQTALILRDIGEEEALRQLRAYFLANITHEFRTPLSTWNASMELLLNETDLTASEMRELLKPLHLSLLSLQTLIENLLESSTIEAGRFVLHRQPVDLEQVISAAVQIVRPLLERRRQTLVRPAPALLPPLAADPARLTQVLVNLLSNAAKYSPPGSTVTLEIALRVGWLAVSIADQGPGIPPQERQKLFQRFVRLGIDTAHQYGIGLGLYLVKTTVEAHGGHVGVDEQVGGGSRFWFELPIEPEDSGGAGSWQEEAR
jgi:signal transduction histidine kinase